MKLKHLTERQKGLAAISALTIVYGLLPLYPRYLHVSFELFQQIYLRMFVGTIILLFIFHKQINFTKLFRLSFAEIRWVFLRAFFYYVLGVGLYTVAILMTKVSNVVFIGSIPVTAILGFWWLGEKLTWQKVSLLILSVIGVYVIAVKEFTGIQTFGLGELFSLISAIFIALGLVMRKKQSSHLNDYETATLMLLFAGVQLFVISLVVGEPLPMTGWNSFIMLVLLASGLTVAALSFLMNYGMARVPAVVAGNIITMSNFFAILIAFIAFSEVPVFKELVGGMLIVTSVIMMHRIEGAKKREKKSDSH